MILTKEIKVTIINHNYHHYKDLGYDVHCRQSIVVPIEHLSKGSNLRVDVKCDACEKENSIKYNDYNQKSDKSTYHCNKCIKQLMKEQLFKEKGVINVSQLPEIKEKKKQTNLKNWGTENVFQNESIKEQSRNTCIDKYGSYSYMKSDSRKNRMEEIYFKRYGEVSARKEFSDYRKLVDSLTRQNTKQLMEQWNGYDYYDNEYIKENFNLYSNHRFYPTIDHKISVHHGFFNNISPEEISKIENLCITKRYLNCKKSTKNNFKIC